MIAINVVNIFVLRVDERLTLKTSVSARSCPQFSHFIFVAC